MFKLTFALMLLVPCCQPQCTSDSCGETDSMETQMRVIMQRLDELTLKDEKQMANIEGLKSKIREQETVNQELRTANAELRSTVNSLQMNISHIERTTSTASAVYFSMAANTDISYNVSDAIKFPVTFTNVVPAGSTGGWDTATNRYTCPVTGDYMFVVTLFKANGASYENFDAHLTRTSLSGAGTHIIRLANNKDSSISGDIRFSSTMQAIVPCTKGEKVWVKSDCSGCRLFDNSWRRNTFTGFKL